MSLDADLEISKPQKNRNNNNNNSQQQQQRRSRSPDYGRGGKPPPGTDRYVSSRNGGRGSVGGYRQGLRSPSPPPRDRYRDRYDYRERSPDYGRRGGGRYRSPSPRRSEDDDLPLPRRAPRDVPDVQVLVLDSLDRDFISWVEQAFSSKGLRIDVLLLSPRLSESAVVRRQIVEGVAAVVKLTRQNQNTGKIGLQIFDRTAGREPTNVSFEEYDNLDPPICAELVLRAKAKNAAPPPSYGNYSNTGYGAPPPQNYPPQQYGQPPAPYGQPPMPPVGYPPSAYPPQPPPQQAQPPQQNLQNLITSLDPNGLQSLLSAMGTQPSPNTPQTAAYGTPQSAGYPVQTQQQAAAMAALQQNPQMAAGLQQAQQSAAGGQAGGQVNMQDLLAKLGSYKQ
jgi:nuclear polyadenylated RNA-binding protein 3